MKMNRRDFIWRVLTSLPGTVFPNRDRLQEQTTNQNDSLMVMFRKVMGNGIVYLDLPNNQPWYKRIVLGKRRYPSGNDVFCWGCGWSPPLSTIEQWFDKGLFPPRVLTPLEQAYYMAKTSCCHFFNRLIAKCVPPENNPTICLSQPASFPGFQWQLSHGVYRYAIVEKSRVVGIVTSTILSSIDGSPLKVSEWGQNSDLMNYQNLLLRHAKELV